MKTDSFWHPRSLVGGVLAVSVLAGCSSPRPTSTAPPSPPAATVVAAIPTVQMVEPAAGLGGTPVRIQVAGTVAEGPIYLATERGYFAQEGISPQFITFDGGAQAIPALATGQIDIGAGGLSAALFNAIDRGLNIRVVAPQSENRGCEHSSTWILVRKDLADSGAIRAPADLAGKKIGLSSTASASEYLADRLLRQANLEPSAVEYVQMAFGDMGAALAGGKIDVAVGAEPTATSFVDRGVATKWLCGADILPNNQFTYLLYSGAFAEQHTEVAQRWMKAYLRGAREWQHMLETGEDRDATLSVLAKYTPVKDLALLERISVPMPAAEESVDITNIQDQSRWMHDRGYLAEVPAMEQIVDTRFIANANQSLEAQP